MINDPTCDGCLSSFTKGKSRLSFRNGATLSKSTTIILLSGSHLTTGVKLNKKLTSKNGPRCKNLTVAFPYQLKSPLAAVGRGDGCTAATS